MHDTDAINALGVKRVLGDIAGLKWKSDGPSWSMALCPFHKDTDPSFKTGTKAPHRGQCFACGADGDVIELAARYWDVSIGEAIRRLATQYGIAPAGGGQDLAGAKHSRSARSAAPHTGAPAPIDRQRAELYAGAMRRASMGGTLIASDDGRAYLERRGILQAAHAARVDPTLPLVVALPGDQVRKWYSAVRGEDPAAWKRAGGTALYRIAESGIGLLLLATLDLTGTAIAGIHARLIDPPDGMRQRFVQVGEAPRPWRAGPIEPGDVVICEGAIDALSWHAAGVQAVGIHGIKTWRPWYVDVLPKGARPIVCMDNDKAGRGAAAKVRARLKLAGFDPRIIELDVDDENDANECLVKNGSGGLLTWLNRAKSGASVVELQHSPKNGSPPRANHPKTGERRSPGEGVQREGAKVLPFRPKVPEYGTPLEHVNVMAWKHLHELIEWAHWEVKWGKDGPEEKRRRTVDPLYALTDAVIRWIEGHKGVFRRDSQGGAWLYFQGALRRIDTRDPAWGGWLYDIARINLNDREGKSIAVAMGQYAQSQYDAPEPRPWMYFDRSTGTIAMHLHDQHDQVAVCRQDGVEVVENGAAALLVRDPNTSPVNWPARPDMASALEAIDRLVLRSLASRDASLVVCWALSCFVRQSLDTRALLFCGGAAGAGKTEGARLITALLHGAPRVIQATTAALWVEGETQPIVALDNQELAQIGDSGLQQWLLLAATGAQRKKRKEGTTSGVVSQRTEALAMVTAIEPPALDELIQRTILAEFEHKLHRADYSPAGVLGDLVEARGMIIAGLLELFATAVIPRIRDVRRYTAMIPSKHPKNRLGRHLGLCALIADVCHQVRPGIWGDGTSELRRWLDSQGARATALAQGTDIIVDALERLLWLWNMVVPNHQGHLERPAEIEQWFRCKEVYGRGFVRKRFAEVVGFEGSYSDLHADLIRAVRKSDGADDYKRRIKTSAQLSARWQHNAAIRAEGWTVKSMGRSGRAGRRYAFILRDPAEREE